MNDINKIRDKMLTTGWFTDDGAYMLFDGQFGSTGKGLLASVIAEAVGEKINTVATNAGPNSGHTAYVPGTGEKVMTQQIPVASVMMDKLGVYHNCYLNGGAVIDPKILMDEIDRYAGASIDLLVHPHAAVIKAEHQGDNLSRIASTGKGVGPAMADKLWRFPHAVLEGNAELSDSIILAHQQDMGMMDMNEMGVTFVETAQGWSLGINSGFYPYTTSRECSVSQALSDLGVSPKFHRKSIVSLRTYPIRVGNHPSGGYSGDVYSDQAEISFEDIGVEPELTTVTQRVRRIFTWSDTQFVEMLRANQPDALFINFMNYLKEDERRDFLYKVRALYRKTMGHMPDFILGGYGPLNSDVRLEFSND